MENTFNDLTLIKVGAKIKVTCDDYSHEGLGICHINGVTQSSEVLENFPIFVFGLLLNESCYAIITKLQSHLAYAEIDTLFSSSRSTNRTDVICSNYGVCGGCNLMHMSYEAQLDFKTNVVKNALEKIGGFTSINVLKCIGSKNPLMYRNKVQVPVQSKYNGKLMCGFYQRETHKISPLETCYIQDELSTNIVIFTKNILSEFGLSGYNEKTGNGLIRHIMVKKSHNNEQIMVVIVATSLNEIKNNSKIVDKLTTRYKGIKSIIVNINTKKGNTILGDKCYTIYGNDYIEDTLLNKKFQIGPLSFYQVNHDQCEVLYSKAIEYANLSKDDILVDAYCGIGTIGQIASDKVKHVYGVEIVDEAINLAKKNASLNNISNATYVCGASEDIMPKWVNEGIIPSVVIVDPPRKGCDESLLKTIVDLKIKKIVYISCDPSTLARDLKYLCNNNYCINNVQPIDMFSYNNHVETCVEISLND